jgi:hypothetical protein
MPSPRSSSASRRPTPPASFAPLLCVSPGVASSRTPPSHTATAGSTGCLPCSASCLLALTLKTYSFPSRHASLPLSSGNRPGASLSTAATYGRVLLHTMWDTPDWKLVVWDPITGDHTVLPGPDRCWLHTRSGTVLCAVAGCDHRDCPGGPFTVVFVAFVSTTNMVTRAWIDLLIRDGRVEPAGHRAVWPTLLPGEESRRHCWERILLLAQLGHCGSQVRFGEALLICDQLTTRAQQTRCPHANGGWFAGAGLAMLEDLALASTCG